MELLGSFDDSLFDLPKISGGRVVLTNDGVCSADLRLPSPKFTPKIEEPCWFMASHADDLEQTRFKASYYYLKANYTDALKCYLAVLNESTNIRNPELLESIARCYLKIGEFSEAENYAKQFEQCLDNFDHRVRSFHLYSTIYLSGAQYSKAAPCLIGLIGIASKDPRHWDNLANCLERDPTCLEGMSERMASVVQVAALVRCSYIHQSLNHRGAENRTSANVIQYFERKVSAAMESITDMSLTIEMIRKHMCSDLTDVDYSVRHGHENNASSNNRTTSISSDNSGTVLRCDDVEQFVKTWFEWLPNVPEPQPIGKLLLD